MTPEELVHDYTRFAAWIAVRFSKTVHSSWWEDLRQHAFLGLWRAALRYNQDQGPFKPYAYQVIVNEIRYFLRWLHRRWESEQDSLQYVLAEDDDNMRDEPVGLTLEDLLSDKEVDHVQAIAVRDALTTSEELRLYAEGYTLDEIAERVGCHRTTAHRRINRARERLRAALEERA